MVLMEKNGIKKYVPDVFVDSFSMNGYTIVGAEEKMTPTANHGGGEALNLNPPEDDDDVDDSTSGSPEDDGDEEGSNDEPSYPPEDGEVKESSETEEYEQTEKCVCPYCGKEYSNSGNLKRHIAKAHPEMV